MYRLTVLGDFPGDAFALSDFSGDPDDSPQLETAWIAWFFFGFGTLFFLVLLLNLLIAIIGDKYEEMQLRAEAEFGRQRANICLEAFALELQPRPQEDMNAYDAAVLHKLLLWVHTLCSHACVVCACVFP